MKVFNVSDTLTSRLDLILNQGSYIFWTYEDTDINYVQDEGGLDEWEQLYRDSIGFQFITSQILPYLEYTTIGIEYSSSSFKSLIKGYLDTDEHRYIIPDTLSIHTESGKKYYNTGGNFFDLVEAMLGGSHVNVPHNEDSEIRFSIPENVHLKGLDYISNIRTLKTLDYFDGNEWITAVELESDSTNDFESIQATEWRISLAKETSTGYIRQYKFLAIVDVEASVDVLPEVEFKGVCIGTVDVNSSNPLGGGVYPTAKGVSLLRADAGPYDSDSSVLFKTTKLASGLKPFLVKFDLDVGGLGNGKI